MPKTSATQRSSMLPPYRLSPESPRRISATMLGALFIPIITGAMFFGFRVFYIVFLAVAAGWAAENLANAVRNYRQPGSTTQSVLMSVIFAMLLPPTVTWHVPVLGGAATVLIGKHVFGGMGHYVWHPALIGRVVVQLFFNNQLGGRQGALLTKPMMFFGDVLNRLKESGWFKVDWFESASAKVTGYILPEPMNLLRHFDGLRIIQGDIDLSAYLAEHLPSLEHCVLGATPGGLGTTSALALMVIGLYFVYRGYLRWQLPLLFLVGVYVSALILPVTVSPAGPQRSAMIYPIVADSLAVGLTYAHYQLFSGGVFIAAFVLLAEMTSRPITLPGQMVFALAAGILTMVFRLYTPIAVPACAAVLVLNTLVGPIDRFTRPPRKLTGLFRDR
ncbi:MAG: RnfABCDGE type electron transport complex subunit D [Sedimentisphaerales bacterium]|nr:RnfABCDGE type electron transport complex subunit D [Sedimentisphaerales bacterium]